jgi:hypothetical protein
MRGILTPEKKWQLKWLYSSYQFRNASRSPRFDALTVYYFPKKDLLQCCAFPQDPYLSTATSLFAQLGLGQSDGAREPWIDILRYVPRCRLTFRVAPPDETSDGRIGKIMRPLDFQQAYKKLDQIHRAVGRSGALFSVAAPAGLDAHHCLFYQEDKGGNALAGRLVSGSVEELLKVRSNPGGRQKMGGD